MCQYYGVIDWGIYSGGVRWLINSEDCEDPCRVLKCMMGGKDVFYEKCEAPTKCAGKHDGVRKVRF